MNISEKLAKLSKNKFLMYGLPFVTFVVGSSFAMEHFASIRYAIQKYYNLNVSPKLREQMNKYGIKFVGQKSIDEEYQRMKQTLDIDNWKNIRGPREYEEMSDEYKQQLEMLNKRNKINLEKLMVEGGKH